MRRWLSLFVVVIALTALAGVAPASTVAAMGDFGVTSARVSPSTVVAGRAAKLETRVRANVAGVATIEATVTDPGGGLVWQKEWSNRGFRRGKTLTYQTTWVTPPDLVSGAYALNVRVLDGNGAPAAEVRSVGFTVRGVEPPAGPAPGPNPAPGLPTDTGDSDESAFLKLINDYRREHNLGPLSLQTSLTAAAVWHTQDMGSKGYFSHTDSHGRDPFQRMAAFGYTAPTWKAENIAAGYGNAAQVFAGWKDSSGHNANMLGEHYRSIGIGRSSVPGSPYGVYWTTTFGGE